MSNFPDHIVSHLTALERQRAERDPQFATIMPKREPVADDLDARIRRIVREEIAAAERDRRGA